MRQCIAKGEKRMKNADNDAVSNARKRSERNLNANRTLANVIF